MDKIKLFRWLTLFGYFGLMALIFCWHLWIKPLEPKMISMRLLIELGPLMLPLRGILHGRVYTHAWSMYLALIYFVAGIWYAGDVSSRDFGIPYSTLSMLFFIGAVFYTRYQGQAQAANTDTEQNND
ncbi:MAG: DUF2069 domain-containing protein [Gammaproteobacteria bacterium]|nr:DUF2069 domain-containing protein [Gammaproteobacteria bacterium]